MPEGQLLRKPKGIAGYLNLLANGIDNFAHGLAVAASFLVGTKVRSLLFKGVPLPSGAPIR